jgi:hypothetical protein
MTGEKSDVKSSENYSCSYSSFDPAPGLALAEPPGFDRGAKIDHPFNQRLIAMKSCTVSRTRLPHGRYYLSLERKVPALFVS